MNIYHQILLSAIAIFVMLFVSLWVFNHVHAWMGVAAVCVTIYAGVRMAIHVINNQNKKNNENK